MRLRDLKRRVRRVYPTAIYETCRDERHIVVQLPYGEVHRISRADTERDAWIEAARLAGAQYPLPKLRD